MTEKEEENDWPQIPDIVIEREIGRGGMGVVYQGRQNYLDRQVAIKVLSTENPASAKLFSERFNREAKILASLSHPNIVTCFQGGVLENSSCYILMEFIEGFNLQDYVYDNGVLEEDPAIFIVKTVAEALLYAHENEIIHRDIKPENILLQKIDRRNTNLRNSYLNYNVKLADLGLARSMNPETADQLTKVGTFVGTPANMAPEQFQDPDSVDFRADIYGLGCVLFFSLTGESPFPYSTITKIIYEKTMSGPPDPLQARENVSQETRQLIFDMLEGEVERRLSSYEELIGRCQQILERHTQNSNREAKATQQIRKRIKWGMPLIATFTLITISTIFYQNQGNYITPNEQVDSSKTDKKKFPEKKEIEKKPDLDLKEKTEEEKTEEEKITETKENPNLEKDLLKNEEDKNSTTEKEPSISYNDIVWGSFQNLFSADFTKRMQIWDDRLGPANWGPAEDGSGIFGIGGTGKISSSLQGQPWQLRGTCKVLSPQTREYGIRFEIDKNKSIALNFQHIGPTVLVAVVEFESNTSDPIGARKVLQSASISLEEGGVSFAAVYFQKKIKFIAGKKSFTLEKLASDPHKVSLYINKTISIHFDSLEIRYSQD